MPRPLKPRWVSFDHTPAYFQPAHFPNRIVDQVELSIDELEAIRLADAEGMSQEEAAVRMNVSRQTFGRIIARARGKTAEALVHGKGLHIQGGNFEMRPSVGPYRGGRHGKGPHGKGPFGKR